MSKRGRGGAVGAKFRMSLALPVGAVMNCADNTGTIYMALGHFSVRWKSQMRYWYILCVTPLES